MAGPVTGRAFRLPLYRGTAVASLRLGAVLALGLLAGGCAMSGSFDNIFAKNHRAATVADARAEAVADVTGAVASPRAKVTSAVSASGLPSETDLVFARMAIVEVLKRGRKEVSAPWENPSSGARGTVTPIASAYSQDGETCHDFLASYIQRQGSENWLQGQACRDRRKQGTWAVKSLRPWTRS